MVPQRLRFVRLVTLWMVLGAAVLSVLDSLSFERLYVVSFLGYLVLSELTAPVNRTANWRRRLLPITLVGVVGFGYVVVTAVMAAWAGTL
ncbi:hypothetical protein C2R22_15485 [Salinigranum rubrum]|uniref:Uncharacterized protein n=1 Tax=Salinigranum rubrum TaxID=755307 RepID=A0A2I8VLS7_9EURY|nr:hypothetical protein [Salinigranum rubrum]AUV82868.1 hypothetical protein C2R22_15485 [Salinigranum rubrum]